MSFLQLKIRSILHRHVCVMQGNMSKILKSNYITIQENEMGHLHYDIFVFTSSTLKHELEGANNCVFLTNNV